MGVTHIITIGSYICLYDFAHSLHYVPSCFSSFHLVFMEIEQLELSSLSSYHHSILLSHLTNPKKPNNLLTYSCTAIHTQSLPYIALSPIAFLAARYSHHILLNCTHYKFFTIRFLYLYSLLQKATIALFICIEQLHLNSLESFHLRRFNLILTSQQQTITLPQKELFLTLQPNSFYLTCFRFLSLLSY